MGHGIEQVQPAVLPLTGSGGIVKDKLSPRQQPHRLSGKSGQIRLKPSAFLFVRAEQHHAASGHLPHGGGDVRPMDTGQARDSHRAVSALRLRQQFLKFWLFDDDFSEFFHRANTSIVWKTEENPTTTPPEHKLRG